MIKIGLLGCGRIGQVHARSIMASRRAKLASVTDAIDATAKSLSADTGAPILSIDECLESDNIDALVICTPTPTHCDLVERGLAKGKAILCEKPLDLSSERITECLAKVGSAAAPLLVGFNRRFDPDFERLQSRIADGDVGDVELIIITSRDPSPPPIDYIRVSGGLFRDMMIHDFDMARFLLKEEPVEVHAMGSVLIDPAIGGAGDVDTACVTLKTARGKICMISNSRRTTYGYDQRIEIHGSKGMLRAGNIHESVVEFADHLGFQRDPAVHLFLDRYMPAYGRELAHFLDCMENGSTPSPTGADGLKAQILADAADQSHKTGLPVKIG